MTILLPPQELADGSRSPTAGVRFPLLALLLVALLLRLPGMGESVWLDETFCSRIKIGPPVVLARTLLSDYHPPAYFLGQHLWIALVGDSELAIRLPALVSGLLAIFVLFQLGRLIAGARVGLFAAALLTLSPVHIWYSHEARPYSTTLLVVLVATYAWYRLAAADDPPRASRRWTWAFALALGFGLFSHYFVLAYLGGFVVCSWICGHPRRVRITLIALALGVSFVVFFLVKAALSPIHTGSDYLTAFTPWRFWDLSFDWFWTGGGFSPRVAEAAGERWLLVPFESLGLVLLLLGLQRFLRGDLRQAGGVAGAALPLLWIALPALLMVLPLVGFERSYIERSALPALPFFLLLIAAGVDGARGRARRALPVAVALALCVALFFSWHRREAWTVYKPKPDWRSASRWIDERLDEGRGVQELFALDLSPYPLSYYDDRIQLAKVFEPNLASYRRLTETLASRLGSQGFPGGWLLEQLERGWQAETRRLDGLRQELRLRVHILDAASADLPAGRAGETLFLLHEPWRGSHARRVRELLSDPDLELVERSSTAGLELLRLRRL